VGRYHHVDYNFIPTRSAGRMPVATYLDNPERPESGGTTPCMFLFEGNQDSGAFQVIFDTKWHDFSAW